jgi:hypothetical protein
MHWFAHGRGAITGFGLLLALFLFLVVRNVSPEPYVYDEADYMYAASLGIASNWADSPSIPIDDFIRAGLHRDGRQALSERIRSGNDALFYRHFHGPLFYFLLIPVARLRLSEHAVRITLLAIPAASLAVLYFGCLWLVPGYKAWIPALVFLCSYSVLWSTELAPHQLFALCSLASLVLVLKWVATGRREVWYGAVVAAALAFCTLEIAFALLPTLAICCFVERRRWRVDTGFVVKSIAIFCVTVLAVWPAALLKLSFLKAYAVLAYLTLFRNSAWGDAGFLQVWRERFANSPIEWLLIAAGVAMWFWNRSLQRRLSIYPLAIFAALALAGTLRVITVTPRYSLAFMPALDLLAGLALVPSLGPLRRPASFAVVALAVAGLYDMAWYQVSHRPHNPNPHSAAVVTYIQQNDLKNKAVLAPQADLPTLHYYFPAMRLRAYYGAVPPASDHSEFIPDAILPAGKLLPRTNGKP